LPGSVNPHLLLIARRGSIIAASLVGVLAFTAIMGWILNTPPLPFPPAIISINPTNACGLLMGSISLLLLSHRGLSRKQVRLAQALAAAILAIGALKLYSVFCLRNVAVDSWLFGNGTGDASNPVRRFAPKMALAFVLLGSGLLLLRQAPLYRLGQLASLFAALMGLLCLQGYAFGLLKYHAGPNVVLMSASSGLALALLGLGLLLAGAQRGAMAVIVSNTAGGLLARRLLPTAIGLPIGLGLLRLAGEAAGFYDSRFGTAIFATALMIIFVAVVWWTAVLLHALDLKKRTIEREMRKSEESVRRLNLELELEIMKRTRALERANTANKDLESFSYSVSHDLRAPLRAISGFSRIVVEEHGAALNAEGRRYLHLVEKSAEQMGQLIDDLLAFSRTGRQPLQVEVVDTMSMVKDSLTDLKPTHNGRRVEINLGDLPNCQADASLLRQVWLNLLANAFKYTRKCDAAVITIGSRREASGAESYFVQDNGAGFDMKYAHRLFGVFQRLHLTDDYEGNGVGLALVQRIVQRHGGRVWTEAKVNQGATFYFTLTGGPLV
jgi:signal transduction histidine kinase